MRYAEESDVIIGCKDTESFVARSPHGASENRWRVQAAAVLALLAVALLTAAHLAPRAAAPAPSPSVVSCYYGAGAGAGALRPAHIRAHLCTHINVAFARVERKQIQLSAEQRADLVEVVKLKKINPTLKVLLSIGGAGDDDGFSEMVVDHASRKVFIRSIKSILRNYTLDGVDLDWEFPSSGRRERQHFSQLLREVRMEYLREKRNYLLTVAVAAPRTIVEISYDVDQLNLYVDYVNIMTYDFHSFTKFTPFTGLNSPLYARPPEQLYMATLNINYTVQMYLDMGLDSSKMVIGIPTYGHTFTLVNADNTGIGSPASGYGSLGDLGFVNYPDVCMFLRNYTNEVTVVLDNAARVPYLFRGREWVSYDSPQSVMEKAKFIKQQGLRGAMIYSLNADDYEGRCMQQLGNSDTFPLSNAVRNALIESNRHSSSKELGVESHAQATAKSFSLVFLGTFLRLFAHAFK